VNWNNNDLPGWRPIVPFPAILQEMRSAGYTSTEWDESFGSDIPALNDARTEAGVEFCGAYRWLDFQDPSAFGRDLEEIRPFLEVLAAIEAKHLIVADAMRPKRIAMAGSVPADGSASLTASAMDSLIANVVALYDVASQYGLSVHYHNHVGTFVETPAEVEACANSLKGSPVLLCFDTGHYAFGGGNTVQFLDTHLDAVGYIHLKDVDPSVFREARAHKWSFLDSLRRYIFCPLGEGYADVAGIIRQLVTGRFTGPVVIEQDTCRGDATENARANLQAVERMMRSVGSDRSDRP
jgi:inosose dehydratase